MLTLINKRLRSDERGFTLIELMVVVLIIAILIAIAIPTFLGARKRAQRKQAQSALRNALTIEKTYYTDAQTFTADGTAAGPLKTDEPNLKYNNGTNTTTAADELNEVSISVSSDSQSLEMAAWSKSKDCYYIFEGAPTGTTYGKTESGTATSCIASVTSPQPASTW